jgi:hypothetical protein
VAKDNLGRLPSLIAAASLFLDYVLTVSVSIAAGVAAITSALPAWHLNRTELSLAFVSLELSLAFVSLLPSLDVRESVADPGFGKDVLRRGGIRLELLP